MIACRDVPAARLYNRGCIARLPRIVIPAQAGIHNTPMDFRFRGNDVHKTASPSHRDRNPSLAQDPNLDYDDAAELQLLLERFGK